MPVDLRATYRLQLHPGFTLDDATATVAYLKALGVSHVYTSPFLQAAPDSAHGYDVVNHHQVNAQLGGSEAFARLCYELMQNQMGLVVDVVPNHMAISADNPWWQDVLENGASSAYASYFDVDWGPPEAKSANAVMLPVLGDHVGRVLEAGEIKLLYECGKFALAYYDNRFPIDPRSFSGVLSRAAQRLDSPDLRYMARAFGELPQAPAWDRQQARRRSQDQAVLVHWLERLVEQAPDVDEAIQQAVDEINRDPNLLEEVLQAQNYRLAFWRITTRELGYRRFFDINNLIGLRMEDPAVYEDTHALLLGWLKAGLIDGLRIDHPDGLRDPLDYFTRLRQDAPNAWIVIEKILEPGERLPDEWPIDGTTGYDFMFRVNNLLVDPAAEQPLSQVYSCFTGEEVEWTALVREKKLAVANDLLGSDLSRLADVLVGVIEHHRRYRDYTRFELREALAELAADLPVYRTFVRPEDVQLRPADVGYLEQAAQRAKTERPDLDPLLFDFLRDLLLLRIGDKRDAEFIQRFQQFSGPLMAKGVEDTAFYNHYRLVSLNEVGGDPGIFGLSPQAFHQACQETQRRWGGAMLATTTHDTKRSEDVRARLDVLSEIPSQWTAAVERWAQRNAACRPQPNIPDRLDEYLIYQTMLGAWPLETERLLTYMEKASREGKRCTSWTNPNPEYEQGVRTFIENITQQRDFVDDLRAFAERIITPGRLNALTQTALKLSTPGVPDIYQGSELWSLSLVDPDNRRPVDYPRRRALLAWLEGKAPAEVLQRADEAAPKLYLIQRMLALRARRPQDFASQAAYRPLEVNSRHALAFQRGDGVVVVAPRLSGAALMESGPARLDDLSPLHPVWARAGLDLPPGEWRSIFGGGVLHGRVSLLDVLRAFPVGVLEK